MNLFKYLKGCKPDYDNMQTIEGITVLPITSDISLHESYADPDLGKTYEIHTRHGYGKVTITNKSDKTLVLPPHLVYARKGGQDHMVSNTTKTKTSVLHNNARCVESSQGGSIFSDSQMKNLSAPFFLRLIAYQNIKSTNFREVWNAIAEFNNSMKCKTGQSRVMDFFEKYEPELDKFIAHFEYPGGKTIGFFIFFNNQLIGVEKFPSYSYCRKMWDLLIRNSYCPIIMDAKNRGIDFFKPKINKNLSLENIYNNVCDGYLSEIKDELKERDAEEFAVDSNKLLQSATLVGEAIKHDDNVYSLISFLSKIVRNKRHKKVRTEEFSL